MSPQIRAIVPLILLVGVPALAQNQPKSSAADQAWANVLTLTTPSTAKTSSRGKSAAQLQADKQQQATRYKQASAAAKAFYAQFPDDPRAAVAKQTEAMTALSGIQPGDADKGQVALEIAANYRSDPSYPAPERFEVAALMERQQYAAKNGGRLLMDAPEEHEKVADALRAEFGDTPQVYGFYLNVVGTADMETANRVAQKVIQLPAPAYAKSEAQVTVDRHKLVGKTLELAPKSFEGRNVDLKQAGHLTVVYCWSAARYPNQLPALTAYKSLVPADTQWVFVAVDSTPQQFAMSKFQAPVSGLHCLDVPGNNTRIAETLKLRRVPYIYVIDRQGVLAGYGRPEELSTLLKNASH